LLNLQKVSKLFGKGNYKYLELDGEAQSWNNQRMVVARGKANSERNGVDFDSDEENGNGGGGGGGGDQEPFDWEKEMRKRVKEIEERRELVKKAEELQNRIFDDNSQEEKEESEEEKKERVRKELEKVTLVLFFSSNYSCICFPSFYCYLLFSNRWPWNRQREERQLN